MDLDSTRLDQRYVIEGSAQRRYVANRDAPTFLPFFLPHLHPGMDVLDAGCGLGSIALDLAPNLVPGRVVGIDFDAGQIEVARRSAAERELHNAQFVTSSVYEIPFPDASFDAVYSVAVLMYLRQPGRALSEMRRVLRPGGLAAVIDDDHTTVVMSPDCAGVSLFMRLFGRMIAHEGGDPHYSRHLRRLMREAGFARTQGVAHAPEVYGDAASTRWAAEVASTQLGAPSMREVVVAEGWASQAELDDAIVAIREWADGPDAFLSWLYCGALGWTS